MLLTAIPGRSIPKAIGSGFGPSSGWLALPLIVLGAVLLIRRVAPLQVGTNQRFRLAALIGAVMFALHGLIDVSGHRVSTCLFRDVLARPFAASPHATAVVENNPVDVSAPRSHACRDRSFLDDCLALDGDVAWRGRGRQRQAAAAVVASRGHNFWRGDQPDYARIELGAARFRTLLFARHCRDRTT